MEELSENEPAKEEGAEGQPGEAAPPKEDKPIRAALANPKCPDHHFPSCPIPSYILKTPLRKPNAPSSAAAGPPSPPESAVSLEFLRAFVRRLPGGGGADSSTTVAWVVREIVRTSTAATRCSYASQPLLVPREHTSTPTWVVAHPWDMPFADLVASLDAFASGLPPAHTFFWLDAFAVSQHNDVAVQQPGSAAVQTPGLTPRSPDPAAAAGAMPVPQSPLQVQQQQLAQQQQAMSSMLPRHLSTTGAADVSSPSADAASEGPTAAAAGTGTGADATTAGSGGGGGDGSSSTGGPRLLSARSLGRALLAQQQQQLERQEQAVAAARAGVARGVRREALAATLAAVRAARCGVLLVLGREARPLQRGWCVAEVVEALRAHGPEAVTLVPADKSFHRADLVKQLRELDLSVTVSTADIHERDALASVLGVPPPAPPPSPPRPGTIAAADAAADAEGGPPSASSASASSTGISSAVRRGSRSPSRRTGGTGGTGSVNSATGIVPARPDPGEDDAGAAGRALVRQLQLALLLRPMDGALPARMLGAPVVDMAPLATNAATAAASRPHYLATPTGPHTPTIANTASSHAAPAPPPGSLASLEWLWDWSPFAAWLALPPSNPAWRALLLTAPPGAGKTTALASLMATPTHGSVVAACHFCSAADARSMAAGEVVRSLSYQLACRSPGFGAALCRAILDSGAGGGGGGGCGSTVGLGLGLVPDGWLHGVEEVVDALLRKPLEQDAEARAERGEAPITYVLLIDGLDEGPATAAVAAAAAAAAATPAWPGVTDPRLTHGSSLPSGPGPYEVLHLVAYHLRHLPGVRLVLSCASSSADEAVGDNAGGATPAPAAVAAPPPPAPAPSAFPSPPYALSPPLVVAPRGAAEACGSVLLALRRLMRCVEVPLGALRRDKYLPLALAFLLQEYVLSPELTSRELLWQARGCLAHVAILQLLVQHAAESLGPAGGLMDGSAAAAAAAAAAATTVAAAAAAVAAGPQIGGAQLPQPQQQQQAGTKREESEPADVPPRPRTPPPQEPSPQRPTSHGADEELLVTAAVTEPDVKAGGKGGSGAAGEAPLPLLPPPPSPPREAARLAEPHSGSGTIAVHVVPQASRGSLLDEYGILWQVRTAELQQAVAVALFKIEYERAQERLRRSNSSRRRREAGVPDMTPGSSRGSRVGGGGPGGPRLPPAAVPRRMQLAQRFESFSLASLTAPPPLPPPHPPERAARLQLILDTLAAASEPLEWGVLARVVQSNVIQAITAAASGGGGSAGGAAGRDSSALGSAGGSGGGGNRWQTLRSGLSAASAFKQQLGMSPGDINLVSRGSNTNTGTGSRLASRSGGVHYATSATDSMEGASSDPDDEDDADSDLDDTDEADEADGEGEKGEGGDGDEDEDEDDVSSEWDDGGRDAALYSAPQQRLDRDQQQRAAIALRDLEWALQGPLAGLIWTTGCGKISVRHSSFLHWLRRGGNGNSAATVVTSTSGGPPSTPGGVVQAPLLGVPRMQSGHAALARVLRMQVSSGRATALGVLATAGPAKPGSSFSTRGGGGPFAVSGGSTSSAASAAIAASAAAAAAAASAGPGGPRPTALSMLPGSAAEEFAACCPQASGYCLRHVVAHCAKGRVPVAELEALLMDLDFWRQVFEGGHVEVLATSLEHILRTRGPHSRTAQSLPLAASATPSAPRTPPAGAAAAAVRGSSGANAVSSRFSPSFVSASAAAAAAAAAAVAGAPASPVGGGRELSFNQPPAAAAGAGAFSFTKPPAASATTASGGLSFTLASHLRSPAYRGSSRTGDSAAQVAASLGSPSFMGSRAGSRSREGSRGRLSAAAVTLLKDALLWLLENGLRLWRRPEPLPIACGASCAPLHSPFRRLAEQMCSGAAAAAAATAGGGNGSFSVNLNPNNNGGGGGGGSRYGLPPAAGAAGASAADGSFTLNFNANGSTSNNNSNNTYGSGAGAGASGGGGSRFAPTPGAAPPAAGKPPPAGTPAARGGLTALQHMESVRGTRSSPGAVDRPAAAAADVWVPPCYVTTLPHPRTWSAALRAAECPHRVSRLLISPDGEVALATGEWTAQASLVDIHSGRRTAQIEATTVDEADEIEAAGVAAALEAATEAAAAVAAAALKAGGSPVLLPQHSQHPHSRAPSAHPHLHSPSRAPSAHPHLYSPSRAPSAHPHTLLSSSSRAPSAHPNLHSQSRAPSAHPHPSLHRSLSRAASLHPHSFHHPPDPPEPPPPPPVHHAALTSAVFSPDRRFLATVGAIPGTITLWDPATGALRSHLYFNESKAKTDGLGEGSNAEGTGDGDDGNTGLDRVGTRSVSAGGSPLRGGLRSHTNTGTGTSTGTGGDASEATFRSHLHRERSSTHTLAVRSQQSQSQLHVHNTAPARSNLHNSDSTTTANPHQQHHLSYADSAAFDDDTASRGDGLGRETSSGLGAEDEDDVPYVTCIRLHAPGPDACVSAYGADPAAMRMIPAALAPYSNVPDTSPATAAAAAADGAAIATAPAIMRGSVLLAAGGSAGSRVVLWAVSPDGSKAVRTAELVPPAPGGGAVTHGSSSFESGVAVLEFAAGGRALLVVQGCSSEVRVWNIQSRNITAVLRLPASCGEIFALHFAAHPTLSVTAVTAASAAAGGVGDGATGAAATTTNSISGGGTSSTTCDTLLAAVCTNSTELWSLERRKAVATLPIGAGTDGGRTWAESCVAFSPAGGLLATAGALFASFGTSGFTGIDPAAAALLEAAAAAVGHVDRCAATLWDARSGAKVAQMRGMRGPVAALTFSPDGALLATAAGSSVMLWSAASAACLAVLPLGEQAADVPAVAFGRGGAVLLAAGNGGVLTWDVSLAVAAAEAGGGGGGGTSTSATPTGGAAAAAGGGGGAAASGAGGGAANPLKRLGSFGTGRGSSSNTSGGMKGSGVAADRGGHTDRVAAACFSPDGSLALTGGHDNTVRLWDVRRQAEVVSVEQPGGVMGIAWSPDGNLIAVALSNGTAIVWHAYGADSAVAATKGDFASYEAARFECTDGTIAVSSVSFSVDGSMLVTAVGDGTATLWSTREWTKVGKVTPKLRAVVPGAAGAVGGGAASSGSAAAAAAAAAAGTPIAQYYGATMSADNRWLLLGHGREVLMWNVRVKREAYQRLGPHGSLVSAIAASPQGKILAVGSGPVVTIWGRPEPGKGGVIPPGAEATPPPPFGHRDLTLMAHADVTHLSFNPDGIMLAASLSDGSISVWETQHWKEIGWLTGHGGAGASCVVFSPDSRVLLSTGGDGRVLAWSTRDVLVPRAQWQEL
ncbi:hypothetical protein Agub_g6976 [Astrephomene gubernaculifera]|uniref:Nephrocystin 3-like N-terminal domain-containing protein n=1 Tax=Astrephomene gubernaculifera TaxID=47775 RepID=A0AAD3DS25_9CHLO|nr:hypothetical protein Agub_g6976 [Astrephomene gubernaculifera]